MKAEILKLLSSESFNDYLSGLELMELHIGKPTLSDADLDQDIIERACAVLILERWAQHDDFYGGLEELTNILPNYGDFLTHKDIGHHLRGVALFINGLLQNEIDLTGFFYVSASGYLMSLTSAEAIKEYFEEQGNAAAAADFEKVRLFFDRINSAQFGLRHNLMQIQDWNQSMVDGFYNILTASDYDIQYQMLNCLYKVVKTPMIKDNVFGKYLKVLKKVKDKYKAAGQDSEAAQVDLLIDMIKTKSKGK